MKPNSILNAEENILNLLIADPKLYWRYCTKLKDDFFSQHTGIWGAYKSCMNAGEPINIISLNRQMGGQSFELIAELTKKINYEVDIESWIDFLNDEILKQKTGKLLIELNQIIQYNETEKIIPKLHSALNDLSGENEEFKPMKDHVRELFEHIEKIQTGKNLTGFPTGINSLDSFMGGIQPTDLTIIGAETSKGKTAFSLTVMYNNILYGNYSALFSMEMNLLQITSRLIAIEKNISAKDVLTGKISLEQLSDLKNVLTDKILLDNTRQTSLDGIIAKCRYFISRFKCKLFFMDYLQLISFHKKGQSPEQNLADICRTLKNFAKENDVAIILLSQLNRDNTGNLEPQLNRLRGSGQIEEAADNVLFITRPQQNQFGEPEPAEIILSKGRNCGIGKFDCIFYGQIPVFQNI